MCHSVEQYMPRLARQGAEHRLAAHRAATLRERALVDAALALLRRLAGALRAPARMFAHRRSG